MANKLSAADVAAVKEVVEAILRFIESGDVDKWLQCLTEDEVIMPPGMPPVQGRDRLKMLFQENWSGKRIVMSDIQVDGREDLAIHIAHITLPGAGVDGGPLEGKHMHKLVKQSDGVWRIQASINNWDVPNTP